jgi:hypothetical protein
MSPPSPLHQTSGAAQPATQKLLPLVHSSIINNPNQQSRTMVPSPIFLSSLFTSWGTTTQSIVALSNTHQVVSLKITTTNYLYWQIQMKPYLLGQDVFHFIDTSVSCPPYHVSNCSDGSSLAINPSFLRWKQQNQLILSALLTSLSLWMSCILW